MPQIHLRRLCPIQLLQMLRSLRSCLLLSLPFPLATARLVNITVDDTNPDPLTGATISYSPAEHWKGGNGCANCRAKLNASLVRDATWHDATYNPSTPGHREVLTANFPFNGAFPGYDRDRSEC